MPGQVDRHDRYAMSERTKQTECRLNDALTELVRIEYYPDNEEEHQTVRAILDSISYYIQKARHAQIQIILERIKQAKI